MKLSQPKCDVSARPIRLFGGTREALIGTDFSNYFTESETAREGYRQVFAKGHVIDYPLTIRHKDERLTEVLYNASVCKDTRGNVLGVFAAARLAPAAIAPGHSREPCCYGRSRPSSAALARELDVDINGAAIEQLMQISVTTVSRQKEPQTSTAAVYVLSHEDIRRAGNDPQRRSRT